MAEGSHSFVRDERNENVLIYVNGDLFPRNEAKVSVFDSAFLLGDGVWEGIRLHNGRLAFLDAHLERLFKGAKAIDLKINFTKNDITDALYQTTEANNMKDNVHIRLMISRGNKKSPGMDPRLNLGGPTIVIIAEYKKPNPDNKRKGIKLITSNIRRGSPDIVDHKINSHNKLNGVLAAVDAANRDADEALMLDPHGFVSTCNSTNFFMIYKGIVYTSTGDYCLNGITRGNVIQICKNNNITINEKNLSLTDVRSADEAFVTGTFGGITPAVKLDGKDIGEGVPGPVTKQISELYKEKIQTECES